MPIVCILCIFQGYTCAHCVQAGRMFSWEEGLLRRQEGGRWRDGGRTLCACVSSGAARAGSHVCVLPEPGSDVRKTAKPTRAAAGQDAGSLCPAAGASAALRLEKQDEILVSLPVTWASDPLVPHRAPAVAWVPMQCSECDRGMQPTWGRATGWDGTRHAGTGKRQAGGTKGRV